MRAIRRITVAASLALAAAAMGGCAGPASPPPPEPAPLFASDEEAFAAAEATYRAYVAASNRIDVGDPKSFEPVFDLTGGSLNAADRKTLAGMYADGYRTGGQMVIDKVVPREVSLLRGEVSLDVCLYVGDAYLYDVNGVSVVDAARNPFQALTVSFSPGLPGETVLRAIQIEPSEELVECG